MKTRGALILVVLASVALARDARVFPLSPITSGGTGGSGGTGTGACLTIQGALQKLPKNLDHLTTITVAAGNYTGARINGFVQDQTQQGTTGGLLIEGTLANITPTTGTATGTATSGTAGSSTNSTITFGTLTDSTQSWTVNDLRGRIVTITGGTGSGQQFIVASNTATSLTIEGVWTAPTRSSTYALQDSATVAAGATCVCSSTTASPARCLLAASTLTVTGTGSDVVTYICL